MGLRGPAPTPTKVLHLRGTFRRDRHGGSEPQPATLTKIPRPPKNYDKVQRQLWRSAAQHIMAADLLAPIDLGALDGYVQVYSRALAAEAVVAVEGRTIETPQGKKRHPELLTAEKARADMRRYEQMFGMSPSDRARLRIQPQKPAPVADPWDEVASG